MESYNVAEGSNLKLVLKLIGDIGVFDLHTKNPHRDLLLKVPDEADENQVNEIIGFLKGNEEAAFIIS